MKARVLTVLSTIVTFALLLWMAHAEEYGFASAAALAFVLAESASLAREDFLLRKQAEKFEKERNWNNRVMRRHDERI